MKKIIEKKFEGLKPFIKWSGGKSSEIKNFEFKYPDDVERYIEPFVGGGSVFLDIRHNNNIINDISFELTSLYKILSYAVKTDVNLKNIYDNFIKELKLLSKQRTYINNYVDNMKDEEIELLFNVEIISTHFLNEIKYVLLEENLKGFFKESLHDKIKRIKNIQKKEDKNFNTKELREHVATALQSGLYFYARMIYNNGYVKHGNNKIEYYIANWYYVREFCYSSMFRFSKNGIFNVPYGGIGYNSKDLEEKIKKLQAIEVHYLLNKTIIENIDFEDLFKKYNYFEETDFIFLDPPYDTEFSQYNKEKDFDKNDQIRLRDELKKVKAKWMLIIKETDFILKLYEEFVIRKFDKKYMTNMRNRNDKDVVHLIITNY